MLIAARADVREELDRLAAHVAQAQRDDGERRRRRPAARFPVAGIQSRVNTLCAKSNDVELTNIGIAIKGVVEQFREQVQNLE